jgi:uncharacterized protein (TIGR03067 family)
MPTDLDRLQGNWNITALEIEGQPMPSTGARIVIHGTTFTTVAMGAEYAGTIEIDTSRKPKRFDLAFTEGPEKGDRSLGIYELDGDIWRICLGLAGKTRPRKFSTAPGSGHALETLKRGPAEEEAPAAPVPAVAAADHVDELSGEWQMVSCIRDGYTLEPMLVNSGRRIGRGNETITMFGKQVFMRARYTLDAGQSPKTIDYAITAGSAKGKTQYGIYEMDRELLRICYAGPEKSRPTDFLSATGDGKTVTVWKPAKK